MFKSQIERHTQRVNQVKTTGQLRLAMKQRMTISTPIHVLYCTTSTKFVKDAKLAQSILAQNDSYTSSRCFLTVFTQNRSYHDNHVGYKQSVGIAQRQIQIKDRDNESARLLFVAENCSHTFYILTQNPQCSSRGVQFRQNRQKEEMQQAKTA